MITTSKKTNPSKYAIILRYFFLLKPVLSPALRSSLFACLYKFIIICWVFGGEEYLLFRKWLSFKVYQVIIISFGIWLKWKRYLNFGFISIRILFIRAKRAQISGLIDNWIQDVWEWNLQTWIHWDELLFH
jgi:hypothetical protein